MKQRHLFAIGLALAALTIGVAAGHADEEPRRPRLRKQVMLLRAELAALATHVSFAGHESAGAPSIPGGSICADPCATDSDQDGLGDCEDYCPCDPNTADGDGDAIPDCADPCPDDAVQACIDPCNVDSDGDGAKDCEDPCPWDPAAATDEDGDGIPGCQDFCPGDPENLCFEPCKVDRDGDNIGDCEDPCPWAGTVSPDGEPTICLPPPIGK